MNSAAGADHGPVGDDHVSADGSGVGQHDAMADGYIVCHMHVRHQKIVVAQRGDHSAASRAAVQSDKFADFVPMADARFGGLALVLQILRRGPDRGVRVEHVVFADLQRALQIDVRFELRARADFHVRPDNRIGSDFRRFGNAGARIDDGAGMNGHAGSYSRSANLQSISASATSAPSTHAVPLIFATVSLRLTTFISMRS